MGKLAERAEQEGKLLENHRSKSTQPNYLTRWSILYRKLQRWQGCAATITESAGEIMYGCLWELDMEHLETLDNQEGVHHGFYDRIKLEVGSKFYRTQPKPNSNH